MLKTLSNLASGATKVVTGVVVLPVAAVVAPLDLGKSAEKSVKMITNGVEEMVE